MFPDYKQYKNPEQLALETMIKKQEWIDISFISPPDGLHTYPWCYHKKRFPTSAYDFHALSVHFTGNF